VTELFLPHEVTELSLPNEVIELLLPHEVIELIPYMDGAILTGRGNELHLWTSGQACDTVHMVICRRVIVSV